MLEFFKKGYKYNVNLTECPNDSVNFVILQSYGSKVKPVLNNWWFSWRRSSIKLSTASSPVVHVGVCAD